jgi:hypothetical protein
VPEGAVRGRPGYDFCSSPLLISPKSDILPGLVFGGQVRKDLFGYRLDLEDHLSLLAFPSKSSPHFKGLIAIQWKYFLPSLCFFPSIKSICNHL